MSIEEIVKMSIPERITLVEQIWDSIAAEPDEVEITEAQRRELDRRLAAWKADPDAGDSWENVKARILNRK